MKRRKKEFLDNDSGAVAVVVAIGLLVFLGFAALAIDFGNIVYVRRELTRAAEAGALAGARGLWPMDFSTATDRMPKWYNGESYASTITATNLPTPKPDDVFNDVVTVKVGRWDYSQATEDHDPFSEDHVNPNAVRVTIRRNNVPKSFAQILTQDPINIERRATAVMDFATAVGAGTLPIALNRVYTPPTKPTDPPLFINFTPDQVDNGGWFAESSDPASAKTFKEYIDNFGLDSDKSCPPLVKDVSIINLQNGQDTSVLKDLNDALAASTTAFPDGKKYLDAALPVVNTDKFNHSELVRDFVPVRITKVDDNNPKGVTCTVLTAAEFANAVPGFGAGAVGAMAPPKLVQ